MSGCVNCVWNRYQDELDEWAAMTKKAKAGLAAQRRESSGAAHSMDDDGGGSQANWQMDGDGEAETGDLLKDLPVGIREFMKTDRMLKQKHMRADQTQA